MNLGNLFSQSALVGPGSRTELVITPELSDLIREHNKYLSSLSVWKQYLVWKYTIGSSKPNKLLIIGHVEPSDALFWASNFFADYNVEHYGLDAIEQPFKKYSSLFRPGAFRALAYTNPTSATNIAFEVLEDYDGILENIILGAPVTKGNITVFKASTHYPGLPDMAPPVSRVFQKPFNSTTYDPQFNFSPFLSNENCCIFIITVPKGSKVLAIDQSLHAYPHEREVLLPYGTFLEIYKTQTITLDYISKENQQFIPVQNGPPFVLGEVFRIDPLAIPNVQTRQIQTYFATLIKA